MRTLVLLLCLLVAADVYAEQRRSSAVRRAFLKQSGYPKGRPGYVVDHIIPLCAGGRDTVANLQWQTAQESKRKDRLERKVCAIWSMRR